LSLLVIIFKKLLATIHQGSPCNLSGTNFSSTQPSLRSKTSTMVTSSDSLIFMRERVPNHADGLRQTMAPDELPRVRTDLQSLLAVPSRAPHPVETNAKSARHRYLGNTLFTTHRQM